MYNTVYVLNTTESDNLILCYVDFTSTKKFTCGLEKSPRRQFLFMCSVSLRVKLDPSLSSSLFSLPVGMEFELRIHGHQNLFRLALWIEKLKFFKHLK